MSKDQNRVAGPILYRVRPYSNAACAITGPALILGRVQGVPHTPGMSLESAVDVITHCLPHYNNDRECNALGRRALTAIHIYPIAHRVTSRPRHSKALFRLQRTFDITSKQRQ